MPKKKNLLSEEKKIILDGVSTGVIDSKDLWKYTVALTDFAVPYRAICEDHTSPWHLFCDTYFQKYQVAVAMGPRGGGKTHLVSRVIATMLTTIPSIEIACVAAIQKQADRCSNYVQKWISNPVISDLNMVIRPNQREKELSNGARYDQLVGTMTGSNSPHPQKLFIDEVDLMNLMVLEELKMVPMSSMGIVAQTLYISSRKSGFGPMQKLIDNADELGAKIYAWCWKEVSEPCPDWRSGTKKTMYEGIDPETKNPIVFEAFDKCNKCPLLYECRGDIKNSTGWIPIDDTIREYNILDKDTWLAQKCCRKPRSGIGILSEFRVDDNVDNVDYDPDRPIDLVWDWGTTAHTVCLFVQEDIEDQRNIVKIPFEYRATRSAPVRQHGEAVREICKTYGIIPRKILSDSAAVQQILDLKDLDYNFYSQIRGVPKRQIEETIPLLKRLLRRVDDSPGLKIDANCNGLIKELLGWERDYKTGKPKDRNCDGIDALRYWCMDREQTPDVSIVILGDEDDSSNPKDYGIPDRFVDTGRDYDYLND